MASQAQTLLAVIAGSTRRKVNYWVSKALVSSLYDNNATETSFSPLSFPLMTGGLIKEIVKSSPITENSGSFIPSISKGLIRSYVIEQIIIEPSVSLVPSITKGSLRSYKLPVGGHELAVSSLPKLHKGTISKVVVPASVQDNKSISSLPTITKGGIYAS